MECMDKWAEEEGGKRVCMVCRDVIIEGKEWTIEEWGLDDFQKAICDCEERLWEFVNVIIHEGNREEGGDGDYEEL